LAVARRRKVNSSAAASKDAALSYEQEVALTRLREIAAQGMDGADVDGGGETAHRSLDDGELAIVANETRAHQRIVEALIFASPEPLSEKKIAAHLPEDVNVGALVEQLQADYEGRGFRLVKIGGKWAFRTAEDLSYLLEKFAVEQRRLSKAALETLAIIAYHQPVTRAEIEEIRGVQTSRGTLDVLLETNWIRLRGRRRAPGKPVTYGTTDEFLSHFGLAGLGDLPGLAELKGSGLLDSDLPPDFAVPDPKDVAALMPDELPLEEEDDEALGLDDERDDDEQSDVAVGHSIDKKPENI